MLDLLSLAVGGGLTGFGTLIGVGVGSRRKKPPPPPIPKCSCSHMHASHDKAGVCTDSVQRASKWEHGYTVAYEYVPCACNGYDGPQPITSFYSPPLSIPADPTGQS